MNLGLRALAGPVFDSLRSLAGPMLAAMLVAWAGVLSWTVVRQDLSAETALLLGRSLDLQKWQIQVERARLNPLGHLSIDLVRVQGAGGSARVNQVTVFFDPWQALRGRPRPREVTSGPVEVRGLVPGVLRAERTSSQLHDGGRSRVQAHGVTWGGIPWPVLRPIGGSAVRIDHVGAELAGTKLQRLAAGGMHLGALGPVEWLLVRDGDGFSLRGAASGGQATVRSGADQMSAELELSRLTLPELSGAAMDLTHAQLSGAVAVALRSPVGTLLPLALRRREGALTASGSLLVSHLGLSVPELSGVALPDVSVALDGEVSITRADGVLRVAAPRISLTLGEARLSLSGEGTLWSAAGAEPVYQADVELALDEVPCGQLLASMPPRLVPRLDGLGASGSIGGALRVALDSRTLPAVTLGNQIDVGCRVTSDPPRADVHAVLDQRLTIERPGEDGRGRRLPLGAAAPGAGDEPGFQPLDELPWPVVRAFLVAEDNQFFVHHGFDVQMLARALGLNLQEQRALRGASTISQQLTKNLWLRQERAVGRKLEEAVLTWRLEQVVPKERILEVYLNLVELGSGIYGLSMAAQHYFGVPAPELTVDQAAQLAALLPAPRRGMDGAWERRYHELLPRLSTAPVPRGHKERTGDGNKKVRKSL